jgi:hypothetical protein
MLTIPTTTAPPLPLLPVHDVYLTPHGQGNECRFAGLFGTAWERIPQPDQQVILTHWRNCPWPQAILPHSPCIELLEGWSEALLTRTYQRRASKALGHCGLDGHELRFRASVVDRMPEVHVLELIAHELAHVYLKATGDHSPPPICEVRADLIMARWGFDPFAMDQWLACHLAGWTRDGQVRWHEPPLHPGSVQHLLGDRTDGRFHPRYLGRNGRPMGLDTWCRAIALLQGE